MIFPQIFYDGFQAEARFDNESLSNFEFVDILTGDVSWRLILNQYFFASIEWLIFFDFSINVVWKCLEFLLVIFATNMTSISWFMMRRTEKYAHNLWNAS